MWLWKQETREVSGWDGCERRKKLNSACLPSFLPIQPNLFVSCGGRNWRKPCFVDLPSLNTEYKVLFFLFLFNHSFLICLELVIYLLFFKENASKQISKSNLSSFCIPRHSFYIWLGFKFHFRCCLWWWSSWCCNNNEYSCNTSQLFIWQVCSDVKLVWVIIYCSQWVILYRNY